MPDFLRRPFVCTSRFGCKLLNCKLTCQSAADVCEVVWGELFPGHGGRRPSRNQFEQWRKQLYVWCKFAVLDTLQNKCDIVHLADDATTKGKSVASRKTQIHLTGESLFQTTPCLLSLFCLSPVSPIFFDRRGRGFEGGIRGRKVRLRA